MRRSGPRARVYNNSFKSRASAPSSASVWCRPRRAGSEGQKWCRTTQILHVFPQNRPFSVALDLENDRQRPPFRTLEEQLGALKCAAEQQDRRLCEKVAELGALKQRVAELQSLRASDKALETSLSGPGSPTSCCSARGHQGVALAHLAVLAEQLTDVAQEVQRLTATTQCPVDGKLGAAYVHLVEQRSVATHLLACTPTTSLQDVARGLDVESKGFKGSRS